MGTIEDCLRRATDVYQGLKVELPETMRGVEAPTGSSFRVPLGRKDCDYELEISFSADSPFAKAALFCGDEVVRMDNWGYDDGTRGGFGSVVASDQPILDEVVAEIWRQRIVGG